MSEFRNPKINMPTRISPIIIDEPIDYKTLETAFISANWKYFDGFPTAERLESHIAKGKACLELRNDAHQCFNSGGINIEWLNKKIVVKLNARLAESYLRMIHQAKEITIIS